MKNAYVTPAVITAGGVVQATKADNPGSGESAGKLPEAGSVGFHL